MRHSTNKLSGFTIVELLIVIVVIAILASISIVSYNGIQNRAKASAAAATAKNVVVKAEMANTFKGAYPGVIADFNDNTESRITGSGLILVAAATSVTSTNGTSTVSYEKCTAGAPAVGGARIGAFDYNTGSGVIYTYLGNTTAANASTCTTWVGVAGS